MAARRTVPNLVARVISDPWRKLAAIGLALILWVWLDDKFTESLTIEVGVRIVDPDRSGRQPSLASARTIDILVPPQDYAVVGFLNPTPPLREIDTVRLTFKGSKQVINRLERRKRFVFEPSSAQLASAELVFDFDRHDLVFDDDELANALVEMQPNQVRVALERKQEREIHLTHTNVLFIFPESDSLLADRLEPHRAQFSTPRIRLTGTVTELDAINADLQNMFEVDLSGHAKTTQRTITERVVLRDKWVIDRHIEMKPAFFEVTVPVRPNFVSFDLQVPVQLLTTQTSYQPGDFEIVRPVPVTLRVASPLDAELQGKDDAARARWARENLYVRAVLPKDTTLDRERIVIEGALVFWRGDYEAGVHYRVDGAVVITAHPKKKPPPTAADGGDRSG